ncbi:MAG: hypothetical protein SGI71_00705 [Verrucomicrobiota bacterium]|nr:hypothetical protein [Verrucomicrobiota bacterium]
MKQFFRTTSLCLFLTAVNGLMAHEEPAHAESAHGVPATTYSSVPQAWQSLTTAVTETTKALASQNLDSIHHQAGTMTAAGQYLQKNSSMVTGDKQVRLASALKQFLQITDHFHHAADDKDKVRAESELKKLNGALLLIKAQYPAGLLDEPTPTKDAVSTAGHGQSHAQVVPSSTPLQMEVKSAPLLVPGKESTVTVTLKTQEGKVLSYADLNTSHTEKLHMLIIDQTLTEYFHIHPREEKGVAQFKIKPTLPGPYLVWADIVPKSTGEQQYVRGELISAQKSTGIINKTLKMTDEIDGYKFTMTMTATPTAGSMGEGKFSVFDAKGKPVTFLEPIMGAYAHIVGFNEDRTSIAHIHPMGAEPTKPTDRGGPDLTFHFGPEKPGYYKLFGQVKIKGKEYFADFGLLVSPSEEKSKAPSSPVPQEAKPHHH